MQQEMRIDGALNGIHFCGASLLFRHKVAVRYYFAVSGDLKDYTFTANGESYEPVAKDGLYYVELPGVNPQDWDAEQVLTVSDGNGSTLTVSYSPITYMIRMHTKSPDTLKPLLKAMYNYYLAAEKLCTE